MNEADSKRSLRVIIIGLIGNVSLAALKMAAGVFGHSQTMIADSVNHIGDTISDIMLLIGHKFWTAPPDDTHPHGHRRIETFIAIIVGVLIALTGIFIGYNAIITFREPQGAKPELIALYAAIFSMIIKELLHRYTIKHGKSLRSPALIAKAADHRADAVEAIPAALAVAGAIFIPQWGFLDHVGALIVSVFIIQMSIKVIVPSFNELTDKGAPPQTLASIEDLCMKVDGVKSFHKLRTRHLGSMLAVEIHIQLDGDLTVREGHVISGKVKNCLLNSDLDIIDVVIHIEPDK